MRTRPAGTASARRDGLPRRLPHLPRGLARGPHLLEHLLLLQRVHARPEAVVPVAHELAVAHEPVYGLALPDAGVPGDVVDGPRLEDEEAAVDPALALLGLLVEVLDPVALEREVPEARRRPHRGDGGEAPVRAVERRQPPHVKVGHAVAVG